MGAEIHPKAVLFDAGNTLLRVRGTVGRIYAAVAGRFGPVPDPSALEGRFQRVFAERRGGFLAGVSRPHSAAREKEWWRGVVTQVFRDAGAFGPVRDCFPAFFDALYAEFELPRHWRLFPDVRPCLDALARRRVPVAVVSNWDSRLHPVLRGLGIAGRLRFVLTSAEFGAEKPAVEIFQEGARRLGLAPAQVLHVGDHPDDDYRGARAAGLQSLLLVRGGAPPPAGVEWVADLYEVVRRLRARPGSR